MLGCDAFRRSEDPMKQESVRAGEKFARPHPSPRPPIKRSKFYINWLCENNPPHIKSISPPAHVYPKRKPTTRSPPHRPSEETMSLT